MASKVKKKSLDTEVILELEHTNRIILDAIEEAFTTVLKTAYDQAVLDAHTHSNKTTLDAVEEALTTVLKGYYDTAYSHSQSTGNPHGTTSDEVVETVTKVFVSPAEKTAITHTNRTDLDNVSGTNTGDETAARIATINHGTAEKSAIVDADEVTGQDSENAFSLIRTTWTNIKAFLKTYFDAIYIRPAYGEIYEHNGAGATLNLANIATRYEWTTAVAGSTHQMTITGGNHVIDVDGDYNIDCKFDFKLSDANRDLYIKVYKNGTQEVKLQAIGRSANANNDYLSLSITGILQGLVVGDVIDIRFNAPATANMLVSMYHYHAVLNRIKS